ncbi:lantibiotic dehydratase family protein [Marinifilum sp. RC60d5]|uniref:lantibiotic dehydratase family protein n=1 Tax=Marinifilum sp. RC60d5 TaxID=3458414 RepID=UPI0040371CDA
MSKITYKSFDKFVLRIPLLSLNYIQSIFSDQNVSDEDLKEICQDPKIQEAIFLASPVLYSQLLKWLNNELSKTKDIERLKESLTKYLLRMGSRCTPFGLFAGYGLGEIGDKNKIELDDDQKYYAHLRLDMNYLCALAIDLSKIKEIKEQIIFFPNSSIYKSGDKLRYVEYRYNNSKRNHFVIAVEDSEYLQQVLNTSKEGAQIKDLANLLVDDEISFDEAKSFIEELIDSQLLISELEPSVTGAEFLNQIIDILKPLKNIDHIIDLLKEFENDIVNIRNKAIGIPADIYKKISEKLSNLETKYDIKYLFQTDLVISAKELELNSDISNEILKGIELMNKLTPKRANENLLKFKEAFYERYEEREVPLLQALDVESGVGYIQNTGSGDLNPLVDDLALPATNQQNDYNINWNKVQSLLLKKYNETLSKGLHEIEITDEDVKDFNADWDDLPSTFNAMVEIISSSRIDEKPIIKFSSAGGSSAANLLGRFCHSSSDLYNYVNRITETEKEIFQDSILAEIVHLPESRTGNILLRPQLRDFEIPYLAKSLVSKENQISIKDLVVSVKYGRRVVLRSKSLNKEIIPRLSNAHNFSFNALPVYQFLCDLQTQDLRAGVGFNWGALSNEYSYLPRVNFKNIILSEATWNIKKEEFKQTIEAKDDASIEKEAKLWKMKCNLPDYVLLADGDNELLLNLNNLLCIKTLLSLVKKRPGFQLKEFLFGTEKALVKRGQESFTNQVIFSFYKSQTQMPNGQVENNFE